MTLVKALNADWVDDNNKPFHARISAVYDPLNHVSSINNDMVVAELLAGKPLLYGNTSHAMVQIGMEYIADPVGHVIRVDDVRVADPWPLKGFRALSDKERTIEAKGGEMTFLAAVTVW